jgi:hypothetical protein
MNIKLWCRLPCSSSPQFIGELLENNKIELDDSKKIDKNNLS